MRKNPFIVLEGLDGSGKGTIHSAIVDELKKRGKDFIYTREPGGTSIGERIRELVLHPNKPYEPEERAEKLTKTSETLLMMASRSQLVDTVIKPKLDEGFGVLGERFVHSTYAYQGARGVDLKDIENLDNMVLKGFRPDLTIFLDIDLETSKKRVRARGELDHFEKDADKDFNNVREIYLSFAKKEPENFKIIDSSQPLEVVRKQAIDLVDQILKKFDMANEQENTTEEPKKRRKFKPR